MLELKTKKELSRDAHTLAESFSLVRYRQNLYIPADFETRETAYTPPPERMIWLPLTREQVRARAAHQFNILFASDQELTSFAYMVGQHAIQADKPAKSLLVRTEKGLKELRQDGQMHDPSQEFVPNTLMPMLNEDHDAKAKVMATVVEWLNSEEEAHSLLRHLATALAPGWSAVKYVMLIGEGRNGKSLLMKMLQQIFGWENCSNVTRQQISEQSPVVCELNGKLLNIVFDGRAEYVRDSGMEKSLIAGEVVPIRKLYESTPTPVQTNALFIEGLNREPKSNDKSLALQKRIIRFQFPNVYPLDHRFEKEMLKEEMVGALLALMIDHYVTDDKVAAALAPTSKALELQIEHMFANSLGLQFIKHLNDTATFGADQLLGMEVVELSKKFQAWRIQENDFNGWSEPDVMALFQPILDFDRRSKRVNGAPRKVRVVTALRAEARSFIESLQGEDHAEEGEEVPGPEQEPERNPEGEVLD